MDEEIESLVVRVRADHEGFARDVAAMRAELDGPLGDSVGRAGRSLETALSRAVRTGRFGFEELKKAALAALGEIAAAALRGNAGGGGQGLAASAAQILAALFGAPGRATGGPVAPGRAYRVGERGPELFVPTASGRVEPGGGGGGREVRISIIVNAPAGAEPRALQQSSRQVARAVKRALSNLED